MFAFIKQFFTKEPITVTAEEVAARLRDYVLDFEVAVVAPTELVVRVDGFLIADIMLNQLGTQALITYCSDIVPNIAAEIALLTNDILPTVVDTHYMYAAAPTPAITNNNSEAVN